MPADDLRNRDFQKILLIKLSAIGDVVHTFPVLNKLRRRYPKARIDWLVTAEIGELLRHNPAISNVIEFSRDEWSAPWRSTPYVSAARLIATLRAAEYDLVIDLQGQFRSAVFAFASGARGADRLRQAAQGSCGRRCREKSPTKQKGMPGKARAREAGSLIPITLRSRPSIFIRSSATSASRRCSASMTARPTFPFRSRGRPPPGSMLCSSITISAKQDSSSWRRGRIGKPSNGDAKALPKWRGIFCKRALPSP